MRARCAQRNNFNSLIPDEYFFKHILFYRAILLISGCVNNLLTARLCPVLLKRLPIHLNSLVKYDAIWRRSSTQTESDISKGRLPGGLK
ncbi:MAG TPA: hypothetical protein DCY03_04735 [Planctomycetaceae bacterium]|nr:hypothetical protein [Planctomycetaceae bacterium]